MILHSKCYAKTLAMPPGKSPLRHQRSRLLPTCPESQRSFGPKLASSGVIFGGQKMSPSSKLLACQNQRRKWVEGGFSFPGRVYVSGLGFMLHKTYLAVGKSVGLVL